MFGVRCVRRVLCAVVRWCVLLVASMVDVYCLLCVIEYVLLDGVVCCVFCGRIRVLLSVVSACCWLFDVCCVFRVDLGVVACCCLLFDVCCALFVVRYRLIVRCVLSLCAAR